MPSCCLIRPAGISPTSSTSPATSPCCRCRQNHPNSTRSKMSGSSCATTGSPIVSSGPTTTSLSTVATPGTNSSISLGPSCRSACATGPTGSDQRDSVLLAVAGYQSRAKIAEWLGGVGQQSGIGPSPARSQSGGLAGVLEQLPGNLPGGPPGGNPSGGTPEGGLPELKARFKTKGDTETPESRVKTGA